MTCRICNSKADKAFSAKVLNKYLVDYFHCPNCGFLFTEDPYWLKEAYERPINLSDTGILQRNILFSKILSTIIFFNFNKNGKFLDYAGGYGIFTRLMRDIGFDFLWHDPFTKNIFANGFEYDSTREEKFELLTAFEVFEHLVNPLDEIIKMQQLSNTIIFSTEILPAKIPQPTDWWYYGFEHGQHVSFYSQKTFKHIAQLFNLNLYNIGNIQILTDKSLNNTVLNLEKQFSKIGLYLFIRKKMKSKTFSDHLFLKDIK